MRMAAALLSVLCTGVWSQALAAEPQPPSPPQSAPTSAEQQNTTPPGSEHSAATPASAEKTVSPASATPVAPAVALDAGKAEMTREERELVSRGYKLEIRRGQRYFCRRESELGSHFDVKTCNTAESIEGHRAASVETVREMQANKPEISN
jgi:hypothetical protein